MLQSVGDSWQPCVSNMHDGASHHIPCYLAVPVQKADGSWKLTVDHCNFNLIVALIEAAMTDVANFFC